MVEGYTRSLPDMKRILVTGATGQIGCEVVAARGFRPWCDDRAADFAA